MQGLTYHQASQRYNLSEEDLKWLGRPAAKPLVDRKFDATELEKLQAISSVTSERAWQLQQKRLFQAALKSESESARQAKQDSRSGAFRAAAEQRKAKRDAEFNTACAMWEKKFEILDGWKSKRPAKLKHSPESLLPLDIWTKILISFCDDIEPVGVRGPSVIARELSNAAAVNKELYAASLPAFVHLSALCQPIQDLVMAIRVADKKPHSNKKPAKPAPLAIEETTWDKFTSNPTALASPDLKQLAKAMGLVSTHLKSMLIVNLMEHLELKHPTPVPARLVFAVREEKILSVGSSWPVFFNDHGFKTDQWKGLSLFEARKIVLGEESQHPNEVKVGNRSQKIR